MPKENRKRGPRGEKKKRKLEAAAQAAEDVAAKRIKTIDGEREADYIPLETNGDRDADGYTEEMNGSNVPELEATSFPGEQPFYGMLDEEEQEYFKAMDETLESNRFEDPTEREIFLAGVYKEAKGKELKLANSQSCSRFMEKLIQLSTPEQLKQLFDKFSGNFIHLLQHRFASHCCEALFIQAAPFVTTDSSTSMNITGADQGKEGDASIGQSMEQHFMATLNELEEYLGFLMTHKWGSHALRVLLLVLAGEPITRAKRKGPLQSKKKEKVRVAGNGDADEVILEKRAVPEVFVSALSIMIDKCVQGLNTDFLRALAQHPTGNPTMQLLLQLELTQFGKQRAKDEGSLMHKLLPDDPIAEGTGSASFINGLIYDPVGSRLLETIIEHAPAKTFKTIYREFFKPRLAVLARNDVASYVVMKVLARLSGEDLTESINELLPHMQMLVDRNRIALIRTMVDRCNVRNLPTQTLAHAIEQVYSGPSGLDLCKVLGLVSQDPPSSAEVKDSPLDAQVPSATVKLHGSLLAQSMIASTGPLNNLIYDALTKLGSELCLQAAKDSTACHTMSAALSNPTASIIQRRKLIQQFYGNVAELAQDVYGSRVIDAMWPGTHGLAFIRERIAEELAEAETALRESKAGRNVWRNWKMDLYKRRRRDWIVSSRESAGRQAFVGFPDEQDPSPTSSFVGSAANSIPFTDGHNTDVTIRVSNSSGVGNSGSTRDRHHRPPPPALSENTAKHMSAIERARAKHAAEKAKKERVAARLGKAPAST